MAAEEKTNRTIEDIKRKDKLSGTVVKTLLAGAIIDIGIEGVSGILHISQLKKEETVNRVEDVLQVGQTVDVWVKRIFPKRNRVELTMIEPLGLEWREIQEGMVVTGTVERLEKYGAFVEIGAERPGLVHISELAHGFIRAPEDAVKVGEEIEVKVLNVNRRRKQIKLSLKATLEKPQEIARKVQKQAATATAEEPEEAPVPTAMEMAMREAMEKSQANETEPTSPSAKKSSKSKQAQEGILSRTLENKIKS
jgi:ribosomal protein S1